MINWYDYVSPEDRKEFLEQEREFCEKEETKFWVTGSEVDRILTLAKRLQFLAKWLLVNEKTCYQCGDKFYGTKKRIVCKKCLGKNNDG